MIDPLEKNDVNLTYDEYMQFTFKLINDGTDPLMCAGVMMAQALMHYRTALSEDEYIKMVELMTSSKDDVKTFPLPKLH